jgi:phosphatidate cytidylyltransferase
MTRVLSGAILIALAVYVVWFAPRWVFFGVAELLLVLAFVEYSRLASAVGVPIPRAASGAVTVCTSIGVSSTLWVGDAVAASAVALDVVLMSGFVLVAVITLAAWRDPSTALGAGPSTPLGAGLSTPLGAGGRDALGRASVAVFPALYLGLPVGAMIATRSVQGREALFLLMLTIIVSDSAQYYTGRALGRHLLAPAISPKKTVEGAAGGFVFGAALFTAVGAWWLPSIPVVLRAILGVAIVALGIVGDLFESMLKRSAGVKDSSALIPGHGGVLDRIDALLFAAPIYYVVLKYAQ